MARRKRNKRVTVWLNDNERTTLTYKANLAGLTLSDFIRQSTTKSRINSRSKQLLYEVHKAGVNLNQIAKRCNSTNSINIATLKQLTIIESILRGLI
jgi:hypothetical protein